MNSKLNRTLVLVISMLTLVPAVLVAINLFFVVMAQGHLHDGFADLPHRRVGLVLGTSSFLGSGSPSPYFAGRIQAAASLWQNCKVDFLLLSGDNQYDSYNEPIRMKNALEAAGVPSAKLVLDFAGFSTLDSVIRAKKVFGQDEVTVVSQDFQNQRAVVIGIFNDLRVEAYNAPGAELGRSLPVLLREILARPKAFLDIFVLNTQPRFLGEVIEIR